MALLFSLGSKKLLDKSGCSDINSEKDEVMNTPAKHRSAAKPSPATPVKRSSIPQAGDQGVAPDVRQAGSRDGRLTSLYSLTQAAECLRTLAHPHRLRMIQMLLRGRYTVGELAEACELPSHMASEHLRLMQRCGFLTAEKDGRCVYYAIAEPHLASIMACIESRFDAETAESPS